MNIEKPQTLVNFISFPKFIKGYIMSKDCQLFRIVVHLQKNPRNLDYHLKPLIQRWWSNIKDSGDFLKKTRNLGSIHENTILVTADVVDLYPSIPHEAGLKALREVLVKGEQHTIPTAELIKMADFIQKNNSFEFN